MQAGSVHARRAIQSEYILQWDQSQVSDRIQRRTNKGPMNAICATAKISFRIPALLFGGAGVEPAHSRVIVVRASVNYSARSPVRQIHVRALVVESELQHRHSRNLKPLA